MIKTFHINSSFINKLSVSSAGGISWSSYWATRTISSLLITVDSDTQFTLNWTNNGVTDYTGHKIYISTNGTDYTLNKTVASIGTSTTVTGLTENTRYYIKVAPYYGSNIGTLSDADNDWTAIKFALTSAGDGSGVSTMRFQVTTDAVATFSGTGRWYSDSGGTLNESASYTFTGGSLVTRYFKVPSGASDLLLFAHGDFVKWGGIAGHGIDGATTNHAVLVKNISGLIQLTSLDLFGNYHTFTGDISGYNTSIDWLYLANNNSITGDISPFTSLTRLEVHGQNTLYGSVEGLVNVKRMYVGGSNTLSGDITKMASCAYMVNSSSLNQLTGDVGGAGMAAFAYQLSQNLILTYCRIVDYTAGATWRNINVTINPSAGYGFSTTEMDNILIDMANSGVMANKTINLLGSNSPRSSASDAAVTTLEAAGCTVNTPPWGEDIFAHEESSIIYTE